MDSECGAILINVEDPARRQRFSLAHELAEMLFSVLPQGTGLLKLPGGFRERTKEKLCDSVAANLLMPLDYVRQLIQQQGVNFECSNFLSAKCDVSLTAALVQLARHSPRQHFVVFWRMKNKPVEIRNTPGPEQLVLFQMSSGLPPKKLRVEWSIGSSNSPFIPKDKSIEDPSFIFAAWKTNSFTSGKERMTFDNRNAAWYYSENMPFESDGERLVISLIERLG
jgi:Zn-dependent peptidase ImmA (M78 family)